MKSMNFIFLLLLYSTSFVSSQQYHNYEIELVRTFPFGIEGEAMSLKMRSPTEIGEEFLMCFSDSDKFLIFDTEQVVFHEYNHNFEFIRRVQVNFEVGDILADRMEYISENEINLYSNRNINFYQYNNEGTSQIVILSRQSSGGFGFDMDTRISSMLYINNTIFYWLNDGDFLSIIEPGTNFIENNRNILNTEETRALFGENSEYEANGLNIDENNRLFLHDELITRDYDTFYLYWQERHRLTGSSEPERDFSMRGSSFLSRNFSNTPIFIGMDSDSNYYWSIGQSGILVFNAQGFLIDIFICDQAASKIWPTVHPSGDVYFFTWEEEYEEIQQFSDTPGPGSSIYEISSATFYLYRITRRW